MAEKESNVCVAIDLNTSREILELAELIGPHVCAIKLHCDLVADFSFGNLIEPLVELSAKHKFLLFEDRKFADIGNTVREQYQSGLHRIVDWAHLVTSHVVAGPGTLEALKSAASEQKKKNQASRGVILLAHMSSSGNLLGKNFSQAAFSQALKNEDFVSGFVCQRSITNDPRFIHFVPGVSLAQTGDLLGQVYNTPQDAFMRRGADVVIVGRGITQADDVLAEVQKYQSICYSAYLNLC